MREFPWPLKTRIALWRWRKIRDGVLVAIGLLLTLAVVYGIAFGIDALRAWIIAEVVRGVLVR